MNQKIISTEDEVKAFLKELKELLTDTAFDLSRDLDILPKKRDESPIDPHTTANTLLDLGFSSENVMNQLLALEVSNYYETFIDDKGNSLPPFFAFAKLMQSKDVYIKIKIRDRKNCKVFCVSFHFARYPFPKNLPYG
ncbi:MAG TPA: hypothetical protein VFD03_08815 [Clostridia bacterium]|nr:hypothetical protein [Clostridia bacterium]